MEEENRIQLTMTANPKWMKMLRALVCSGAQMAGFDESCTTQIQLAVDEAATNIIRHCYKNDFTQPIVVYLSVEGPRLEIALRDFGEKKDPSRFKSRDLDDIKPGGLGMHFIYSTMDKVEFDTSLPSGTLLRMVKVNNPQPQEAAEEADGDNQEHGG